jgi:hypothetical protein
MKLELNPSIARAVVPAAGAPPVRQPGALTETADGTRISNASAFLDRSSNIERVAALVRSGSYQVSSTATSLAIVDDALSGP